MTHHVTFNLSPTHKMFNQLFCSTLLGLLSLRNEDVASFLVKYRPCSLPHSLLVFCTIALVFTPFNSLKILFSYDMRNDELHGRRRKLDAIKETGKSHIWPYLRATKWRRDWTPDVLYILCQGWEVDTGFIQPEVEGRGSDSPRAEPSGYHAWDLRPRVG